MAHIVSSDLLEDVVTVHVIGCGGTGSAVLPGLAKIHRSMKALGHPKGLHVTVWDDDEVALHNCIRQNYFEPDVGHSKAATMVNRLNIAHAPAKLRWEARVERFTAKAVSYLNADFVIGCVDSKAARNEIRMAVEESHTPCYWIDCGNSAASGQVIVGQGGRRLKNDPNRLPLVTELFPEIASGPEDNAPSCSALESIMRQGVLTNTMAATWALTWIDAALRHGSVEWSGIFFSLESGRVTAIPADPVAWKNLGYLAPVVDPDDEDEVSLRLAA
jgi:PRTRC genetic system ThiF family protein